MRWRWRPALFVVATTRLRATRRAASADSLASWLVIDGAGLMYRQFYGTPELSYEGQPTGAIVGVSKVLLKVAMPYVSAGRRVVWAMDSPTSWRTEVEETYKATRSKMPDALRAQTQPIREFARAFGAVIVGVEGQEADDVIATIVERHGDEGVDVLSDDKDMEQLVSPTVRLLRSGGKIVDERTVLETRGVEPRQIAAYLALTGDSSDNVRGVAGIGPKSAAKLLTQFDDIHSVLDRAATEADAKSLRTKMAKAHKPDVLAAYRLTCLDRACDLPPDYLRREDVDFPALEHLADKFGLRTFRSRLRAAESETLRAAGPELGDDLEDQA